MNANPNPFPGPFTNPPPSVPTVRQNPNQTIPQRIQFSPSYLLTITGVLRVALVLFQFAAWVSAAAVKKSYDLPPTLGESRSAYLFFSIVGFLIALFILAMYLMNIVSLGFFNRVPWNIFTLGTDVVWIIPTFVLAIVAAVKEGDVKDHYSEIANVGAFGSAAFFGFLNTVIYAVDAIYHVLHAIRGRSGMPSYSP